MGKHLRLTAKRRRRINAFIGHTGAWTFIAIGMNFVSMFLARWRVDHHGDVNLKVGFDTIGAAVPTLASSALMGKSSRSFGLLWVIGSRQYRLSTLASNMCLIADLSYIGDLASNSGWKFDKHGFRNVSNCLSERCTLYTFLEIAGMLLLVTILCMTLLVCLGYVAVVAFDIGSTGGIVFGINIVASLIQLILVTIWAILSDSYFKNAQKPCWFPYANLGAAWYLALVGSILLFTVTVSYGIGVLPLVCKYDPLHERYEKRAKQAQDKKVGMAKQLYKQAFQPVQPVQTVQLMPVQPQPQVVPPQMMPMPMGPVIASRTVAAEGGYGLSLGGQPISPPSSPPMIGNLAIAQQPAPPPSTGNYAMPPPPSF